MTTGESRPLTAKVGRSLITVSGQRTFRGAAAHAKDGFSLGGSIPYQVSGGVRPVKASTSPIARQFAGPTAETFREGPIFP